MSATNRGAKRIASDNYPTPEYATRLIADQIEWDMVQSFCEPCLGEQAIWNVLVPDYIEISEVAVYWYEIRRDRDYFAPGPRPHVDLILTNPPYRLAQEFVDMSRSHASTVIMLMRVNFLGAQKRKDWWQKNGTPSHLYVLSTRPKFGFNKKGKLATDATEYAWYVWDGGGIMLDLPGIYVL